MAKAYRVTENDMRGLAIRLDMLSTHYRKPKDLTSAGLNNAAKTLRRWLALAVPCNDGPPVEVLLALSDDLNTPQAIAEIHRLAGRKDGRAVFAAMKLLGLFPGHEKAIDYDLVAEVKTIPIDHIPLVQWQAFGHEFATVGDSQ
jgi:DALR domain